MILYPAVFAKRKSMGTNIEKKSHYDVMDAIKAIAIISVICGHSCAVLPFTHLRIGRFVQFYHLMAFFFVSGYCFNEKKYADNISGLMGSRLTKFVSMYFCYNAFFVCIHNLLSRLYLISDPLYSRNDILYHIFSGLVFDTAEVLIFPFWFLPVLVFALLFLGLLFKLSAMCHRKFHSNTFCRIMEILFAAGCGLLGVYLCLSLKTETLTLHLNISFLAVPTMYIGWLIKNFGKAINVNIHRVVYILSALLLYYLTRTTVFDLSVNMLGDHPVLFYPITMLGICFCYSLATCICSHKITRTALCYIGKNSFHYMALHLLSFKIIDYIYSRIMNKPAETRAGFPNAYNLGEILIVCSIILVTLYVLGKDALLRATKKTTSSQ